MFASAKGKSSNSATFAFDYSDLSELSQQIGNRLPI